MDSPKKFEVTVERTLIYRFGLLIEADNELEAEQKATECVAEMDPAAQGELDTDEVIVDYIEEAE